MKTLVSHPVTTFITRMILGAVFIVASIDKIAVPEAFATSIQAYELAPFAVVNLIAIVLPWIELVCGILLLAGVAIRANAAILSGLLAVFLVGIGSAMVRGLEIDCGCFGAAHSAPVGWQKIIENIGLMVLGAQMILFPRSVLSVDRLETPVVASPPSAPADAQ